MQHKAYHPEHAVIGTATPLEISANHAVNGHSIHEIPDNMQIAYFAMGCFWGVERLFWQQPGVYSTSAGYSGGVTENPTYEQVCQGRTGHAEVVRVVFDPTLISYQQLLAIFWENHDPSQGMRQGNDIGSQYRSAIYTLTPEQYAQAIESKQRYQQAINSEGAHKEITTEIQPAGSFYFAEDYHQQYLFKNPQGYCGLGGIGICFPPAN
ncbi:TPA: peptide-methionine (S)-S-oxide reductase MsrA [Proteus mirabilis]|uniref:peptide-methionine (S)-S-oxide reductase MsrA n=1 Tax=Proteus mirabilis TaxID=584 RepID=UPI000A6EA350|nr:peptide-methionine (S)-S-oxide reductase MsrA [Proteus mirabilis]MCY9776874.1 peptide-methionine (S)-S-oxide reductase MsrA [Proteus mirabilis]MCY9779214.1 peptide-methionine (S)-S-oxide reductase MsrA [Proteus mirabilis]MCY9790998.1 peptide-methionine (S)-S-oxide reductase MsrA [Proteus mirabilis]MDC9750323.1 peptide-methionine (S)-S-oxide reductase MsrA [Proteus mirabilis]MDM3594455.1 peptide-methionine (S)-S-oxide reductase MsrA [Proteus mirabilis]